MNINWCKNWNGVLNSSCRAGVPYLMLGNDPPKTWPCSRTGGGSCQHRDMPTQAEVDEWRKTMDESLSRSLKIIANIPPGPSGKMDCPNCGKTITYSRSPRNGHLHARCETPRCFAVMQ
jgi:hypothetical protein